MEIEITRLFRDMSPMDYSASRAEIGQNAGPDTWRAACDDAPEFNPLDTDEKREAFRAHVKGFGAWTKDEIAAWTDTELNALFLQMVAGDIREAGLDNSEPDWAEYQKGAEAGQYSGRLFAADNGDVYYYIGD